MEGLSLASVDARSLARKSEKLCFRGRKVRAGATALRHWEYDCVKQHHHEHASATTTETQLACRHSEKLLPPATLVLPPRYF
jgi:hypothetical protein